MKKEDERGEVVRYRLQRARETLVDARILAERERWNACVNRLYYSCFYAVSALLLQHGFSSAKHTGIRGLFNRHFVAPGEVSKELAQLYNDLFDRRQESDYADFVRIEPSRVEPWIETTERFIAHIAAMIER
ncbi:HEPN domain-containing protein [Candidatus Sumerlaeota bacterium]|nr:HEPN domain-containing protein [Candidatus Sumerlaeota bacterium]